MKLIQNLTNYLIIVITNQCNMSDFFYYSPFHLYLLYEHKSTNKVHTIFLTNNISLAVNVASAGACVEIGLFLHF
jgi:hypothetical protein